MTRASSAKTRASRAKVTTSRAIDIVYVGPTLSAVEVRRSLPDADVRGPVAVGEVLRVVDACAGGRGRTEVLVGRIAIIDGYFERMAAVWHKEILLAIEAGIEVWGAASMGALRAAELDAFGMQGVGSIYERFASGELVADDEVAVAHLPAEYDYKPTSVALVDMREAIANAKIRPQDRDRLIEIARAPFYRERTWERLFADAAAAGIPVTTIDALRTSSISAMCKATDARRLLVQLAHSKRARPTKIQVPRTWALAQLRASLEDDQ